MLHDAAGVGRPGAAERVAAGVGEDGEGAAAIGRVGLAALGYTNVREYAEGKQDWIEAGLPVERGAVTAAR